MSEWPNQIDEFQRKWVEQQQKLLSDWLDSMKNAGTDASWGNLRRAADVMEQQVDSALETQKRSLLAVTEKMEEVEGSPEAFTEMVKQIEEGIERWAEVQHRIWKVWFDVLRSTTPAPKTPAETMMENWEDMVNRTMSIQEEWLSKWTGMQPKSAGKSKPDRKDKKET